MEVEEELRNKKRKTIFRQILFSITIPISMLILVMSVLGYYQTQEMLHTEAVENSNQILSELQHLLSFQNDALEIVDEVMGDKNKDHSAILVDDIFVDTDGIESADLHEIAKKVGMEEGLEDIYVINREGVIVNTTFEKDMGLNLFGFGEAFKNQLIGIFEN